MAPEEAAGGATHALVRSRELRFPRSRLIVIEGPDRGAEIEVGAAELSIGTGAGNDLVLTDPSVSRHHVAIRPAPRGALLEDLGSTNGSSIDGVAIERAYLRADAVVALGRTKLRCLAVGGEVSEPLSVDERIGRALGVSDAMRRIFALVPRVAAADATVLLEGETGTGKSLLAEAIHEASPRRAGPFVVVDCGAIPPTLIESELFGHEKGAFTGATAARVGAFESAHGGTLLLDEIGELPLDVQPKLLRALEARVVKRVGGNDEIRLDVRIIAATNRDLRQEINRGRFRSDLFYRLNTVRLRVPPLRERKDDVPVLAAHFYRQFARGGGEPPAELLAGLVRQDWPGNVRELRAAVERAVLLDDPAEWREPDGPAPDAAPTPAPSPARDDDDDTLSFRAAKERAVATWEREYVRALIARHAGNLSRAARAVRMDRNHLRELLRRHRVDYDD